MTVGDALRRRLDIYEPAPCKRYAKVMASISETTDVKQLMIQLPGFREDMRRVVPIPLRSRWLAKQLQLAIKEYKKWHGKQLNTLNN